MLHFFATHAPKHLKTTAQNPPWRCAFSQFLSFLGLTSNPISQLLDDSRSDDEGRRRRSVPFKLAFLLHLSPPFLWILNYYPTQLGHPMMSFGEFLSGLRILKKILKSKTWGRATVSARFFILHTGSQRTLQKPCETRSKQRGNPLSGEMGCRRPPPQALRMAAEPLRVHGKHCRKRGETVLFD